MLILDNAACGDESDGAAVPTTATGNAYEQLLRRDSSSPAANDSAKPGIPDDGGPTSAANVFVGLMQPDASTVAANDALVCEFEPADDVEPGNVEAVSGLRGAANIRLRRVIGPRLFRARELSGLGQSEAAHQLGYATPAQLNQWERSQRLIPASELIKAARLFGVSADYLLGESNDELRDPAQSLRDACLRGVRRQLERVAHITVDQVARHARLVGPHIGTVGGLIAAGDALLDAVRTLCRLNQVALDDMRGSATLVRTGENFEAELLSAREAIRLHDALDSDLRHALATIGSTDPLPGDCEGDVG